LVHGRYAYRRVAKLILYFFYKNATVQFTQFFYIFFNGFSGTSLFDNTVLSLYNVIWTSLPVLGLSFFDKDVSAEISEEFPELYILGQKNYYFNVPRFGLWFLNSIYHSAICFFVPQFALQYVMLGNGNAISERMMGTLIMGCVIIVVTLKIGIEQAYFLIFNSLLEIGIQYLLQSPFLLFLFIQYFYSFIILLDH
jgi:magnesium-transporting ATPase (P-type)